MATTTERSKVKQRRRAPVKEEDIATIAARNPRRALAVACARQELWLEDFSERLDNANVDDDVFGAVCARMGAMLDDLAEVLDLDERARGDAIRDGHEMIARGSVP